jgi:hypothetical protein
MDQGEEESWDTVGGVTERSHSPAPATEATVLEAAQQAAVADEPRALTDERRPKPSATTSAVEPVVAHVEEKAPSEAGIVDIASILGAPTVTVVQSSL